MSIEFGIISFGVLAVGLLVGLGYRFFAKTRNADEQRIRKFNQAVRKLRAAFSDEIAVCRRNSAKETSPVDINSVINSAIDNQTKAFLLVQSFVEANDMTDEFQKVWNDYSNTMKRIEILCECAGQDDYENFKFRATTEARRRFIVLAKIERLFEVATSLTCKPKRVRNVSCNV